MAYVHVVRGNSFNAIYSRGGSVPLAAGPSPSTPPTVDVDATAIGGFSINCDQGATNTHSLLFPGGLNIPQGRPLSVLMRLKFGVNNANLGLMAWISPTGLGNLGTWNLIYLSTGHIRCNMFSEAANQGIGVGNDVAWTPTTGVWYDLFWSFTGDTTANGYKFYVDGSLQGQSAATQSYAVTRTTGYINQLQICQAGTTASTRVRLGESVIWNSVEDPTNIALVGGTGSLNGASRTEFVDVEPYERLLQYPKSRIVA